MTERSSSPAEHLPSFDKHFWLALLLALVVIVPRCVLISFAHCETVDDEYHLTRGNAYWHRELAGATLNDPPLGGAVSVLPLTLLGVEQKPKAHILYGQKYKPETLLRIVTIWKSLLFVPMVAAAFWWVRRIYNLKAAWLATLLLCFEPNLAAFIGSASLDVLGVEGMFFGVFTAWLYFDRPTITRLLVMLFFMAIAIMLKHTAMLVPAIVVILAVLYRVVRPLLDHEARQQWLPGLWKVTWHALVSIPIFLLMFWALLLFDISKPAQHPRVPPTPFEQKLLEHELPGGTYVSSIIYARAHLQRGHPGYLWGRNYKYGWWYYLPAVSLYKIPLPMFLLAGVTLISFLFARPRLKELVFIICCLGWAWFIMRSRMSVGFRHFLPPYIFLMLLTTRVMTVQFGAVVWRTIGWTCVAATAIHGLSKHPNYVSYLNYPYKRVWLDITDSNLDWGQALKQVRKWVDANGEKFGDRPIYVGTLSDWESPNLKYYCGPRVTRLDPRTQAPLEGIVILSPVWVTGTYMVNDRYGWLRRVDPIDIIGDAMLVYDLDKVKGWRKFAKSHRKKPATTTTAPTTLPATLPAPASP